MTKHTSPDDAAVVRDEAAAEARFTSTVESAPQASILAVLPPADPPPGAPFALGEGATPDPLLAVNARTWRDRINP